MKTKLCITCQKHKPLTAFNYDKQKKDGHSTYCRECRGKERREHYKLNREAKRAYLNNYMIQYRLTPLGRYHIFKRNVIKRTGRIDITKKEFVDWLNQQELFCHYCRQPLKTKQNSFKPTQLTIDRRDNSKGYTPNNMVLACSRCNSAKGYWFTEEQMLEIADKYFKCKGQGMVFVEK